MTHSQQILKKKKKINQKYYRDYDKTRAQTLISVPTVNSDTASSSWSFKLHM